MSILSAKSSIVKEKEELKQLMESNISSEEVRIKLNSFSLFLTDIYSRNPNCIPPSKTRRKCHSISAFEA